VFGDMIYSIVIVEKLNIVESALYMNREMATYGDVGLGVV